MARLPLGHWYQVVEARGHFGELLLDLVLCEVLIARINLGDLVCLILPVSFDLPDLSARDNNHLAAEKHRTNSNHLQPPFASPKTNKPSSHL